MPTPRASATNAPVRGCGSLRRTWGAQALPLAVAAVAAVLGGCAGLPLPGARPTPIADRPIDLSAHCAQTEEDGFREDATLRVEDNAVRALSWRLWVGRRGSCRFELPDFRQTRSRPAIELAERSGGSCRLMIWQQEGRITLAHAGCENHCTPGIQEKAWPVSFDARTGRCSER